MPPLPLHHRPRSHAPNSPRAPTSLTSAAATAARCKPMPHYLRSLLCTLAEALYLNRTLVLDLKLCLTAPYAAPGTGGMPEDTWLAPIKFSKVRDTIIIMKFGDVEPGNYWYNVCEGEAKHLLHPLRLLIRWTPSLMHIVDDIISRMQPGFDSVHINAKGEDLRQRVEEVLGGGRQVYVAGKGVNSALLESLKAKRIVHYLDEFENLWGIDSKWFLEMKRLNGGAPVEFDGYMREVVDREVVLKGKKVEVLRGFGFFSHLDKLYVDTSERGF